MNIFLKLIGDCREVERFVTNLIKKTKWKDTTQGTYLPQMGLGSIRKSHRWTYEFWANLIYMASCRPTMAIESRGDILTGIY